MSFKTRTYSVATASWIDKRTKLPEVDEHPPPFRADRTFITGRRGFRFSHLLEVFVNIDDKSRLITGHGFTPASGIYRGPSYGGLPSEYYEPIRSVRIGQEPIVFNQIIGARTQSPEQIGGMFGPVGRAVAHAVKSFPPIWTELELRVYANGRVESSLRHHSLFPSVTFYKQQGEGGSYTTYSTYDARSQLTRWQTAGWGKVVPASGVALAGNPYNLYGSVEEDIIDSSMPAGPWE
ncbi:MAG: hypothetical protein ABJB12_02380 [Pseudomonadota bacterium]